MTAGTNANAINTAGGEDAETEASKNARLFREQEEKLRAKYGGMIPRKNLIVSDRKHFDSADWSRAKQIPTSTTTSSLNNNNNGSNNNSNINREVGVLSPVLRPAKDVSGTSPSSDTSTLTMNDPRPKKRTSMDEVRSSRDVKPPG